MSFETAGRFGIRGAVSGFVVQEPATPVRDAIRLMRQECETVIARLKAHLPPTPRHDPANADDDDHLGTDPASPLVVGPDVVPLESFPSHVMPAPEDRRIRVLKAHHSHARLIASHMIKGLRAQTARAGLALAALPWHRLPSIPAPPRKAATGVAAFGLGLAALIVLVPHIDKAPVQDAIRPALPSQPVWREVVKPLAVFNLEGGSLSSSALSYQANIRSDGAREDVLSWSPPGTPTTAPVGVVVVHQHPSIDVTEQRLFSEIARRAASFGQSLESAGIPNAIATKFGDLEVMDVRLAGPGGEQACLAFRHIAWSAPLAITGWRCGTAAQPIDRPSLVCFIDRLDVLSAADDAWLRNYFADSERFRSFCATKRVSAGKQQPSTATAAPALRPDVTGSIKKKRPAKPARRKKKAA
jgi:hypothetical protein